MNMIQVTLGAYQTNCYIVWDPDTKACAVIDPGYDDPALWNALKENGLQPQAVLLTHGHFDHVGAVAALQAQGAEVWLHRYELTLPEQLCPLSRNGSYRFFDEGTAITVGTLQFSVFHTPGHSPGSCCFLCEDRLFSGDTLFAGSCGRMDLPGGSYDEMIESLTRLASFSDDLSVYPGHSSRSTMAREKRTNPCLVGRSVPE